MSEHIEEQPTHVQDPPVMGRTPAYDTVQTEHFRPKFAGFWTRFWAYSIDLLVVYAISGILIKPLFRAVDLSVSSPIFLLFNSYKITTLIVLLVYFALMTKFFQQTIGKMILGIKVVPKVGESLTWGTIVFREVFGRFISKTLVIPYFLTIFMPKKEALHDLFADTYVVHEDTYEKEFHIIHTKKADNLHESTLI